MTGALKQCACGQWIDATEDLCEDCEIEYITNKCIDQNVDLYEYQEEVYAN